MSCTFTPYVSLYKGEPDRLVAHALQCAPCMGALVQRASAPAPSVPSTGPLCISDEDLDAYAHYKLGTESGPGFGCGGHFHHGHMERLHVASHLTSCASCLLRLRLLPWTAVDQMLHPRLPMPDLDKLLAEAQAVVYKKIEAMKEERSTAG
ncbi:MAG: hypothetical protein HY369_01480 [Candidatus Aenigmarchaeota archaeon]|nr:hypothetical protein [Candidatus Aenigmarchaeota archaeon]